MKQDDWLYTVELLKKAFDNSHEQEILKLLLTPDECDVLMTRVKIIKLLLEGKTNQREIRSQLGIGIATVTRGSNGLKDISPQLKKWLEENLLV